MLARVAAKFSPQTLVGDTGPTMWIDSPTVKAASKKRLSLRYQIDQKGLTPELRLPVQIGIREEFHTETPAYCWQALP